MRPAMAEETMPKEINPEESPPTHFRACVRNVIQVLEKVSVPTPELDARLIISNALGLQGASFFLQPDRLLSETELSEIAQRLARRMAGEPVSRIVGERGFWKHEFRLSPDVLDPRPDSETLIEAALELMSEQKTGEKNQTESLKILDLGTGSGALLISLLLEYPGATGVGIDVSSQALVVAKGNAKSLGCADRADFRQENWLDEIVRDGHETFDLIVCNPPYIPRNEIEGLAPDVALFDPHSALDGGADGLDPYREIIPQLSKVLTPDGIVIFEIGEGQEEQVTSLLREAQLYGAGSTNGIYKDLAGHIRALAATPSDTPI